MKDVGELSERWSYGIWFERITDGNNEDDSTGLPKAPNFAAVKLTAQVKCYLLLLVHYYCWPNSF
jgi:hypothetical protein